MKSSTVAGRIAAYWPAWTVLLVAAHAVLHAVLQLRPGRVAILLFVAGPTLLFVLTVIVAVMAAYDLLHGGWRRLFRARTTFNVLALAASIFLSLITYRVYPSSHDSKPLEACLALPLRGEMLAVQGGRSLDANDHAGSPAERYAYDFALQRDGSERNGATSSVTEYLGYGGTVFAPAAGRVIAVEDGHPDLAPSDGKALLSRRTAGNFVVLEIAPERYLFLEHLQPRSIQVEVGDRIRIGEAVAQLGNSGEAGAPHLHLHVQDAPEPGAGEGVPIEFCGYEVIDQGMPWSAARRVERGMPTGRERRQIIRAADR